MVGVKGVGGIPEPAPERPANVRERDRNGAKTESLKDGVEISPEAKEAADAARLTELAKQEPDVRDDRIAEARAALERGEYKIPSVMSEVAARLSKFI